MLFAFFCSEMPTSHCVMPAVEYPLRFSKWYFHCVFSTFSYVSGKRLLFSRRLKVAYFLVGLVSFVFFRFFRLNIFNSPCQLLTVGKAGCGFGFKRGGRG